jgi:leucyl-tRNA synthetase
MVGPPNVGFDKWKSSRAQTGFPREPGDDVLRIYTTRPDTLFGVTYMVLSPEHPAVDRLTTPEQRAAVDEYRKQAALKSDLDRTELAKTKTGVFTGGYAINPVNGEKVPVWIADYVLISYGTGAIMAVPAHDERDFEFAQKFDLRIVPVLLPAQEWIDANAIGDAHDKIDAIQKSYDPTKAAEDLISEFGAIQACPDHYFGGREKTRDNLIQNYKTAIPWYSQLTYRLQTRDFKCAFTEISTAINSGKYDGLPTLEFKSKITADLAASGLGRKAVNYRLRDWLFSRQRYWGEPFPIWHELDAAGQPTGLLRVDAEADLPITLPEMADFKPTGTPEPMLSKAPESWLFKTAPDGTKLKRETNTMPQWAGSCWYYLRFVDNKNSSSFIDPQLEKQWLPIDLYVGGAEHAVLHLLYSRFWHKVLFDRGHVHTAEPFQRLVNQGMILGEVEFTGYAREGSRTRESSDEGSTGSDGRQAPSDRSLTTSATTHYNAWVSSADVTDDDDGNAILKGTGEKLSPIKLSPDEVKKSGDSFVLADRPDIRIESRAYKMSKSRGNVINPDKVVDEYGADSLRLYEMFMGPLEQVKPWSMQGVEGVFRFLARVWRTITDEKADDVRLNPAVQDAAPSEPQLRLLHKTIKAVTHDIESLGFNTAISRLMEFTNEVSNWNVRPVSILRPFVLLLSPLAPHLAEELWQLLGGTKTLAYEPWPTFDPKLVEDSVIDVPVQINGKLRAKITIGAKADQAAVEAAARREDIVASQLEGKTVVKVVYVPGRMINFVVK